jgi:hypothetical protein
MEGKEQVERRKEGAQMSGLKGDLGVAELAVHQPSTVQQQLTWAEGGTHMYMLPTAQAQHTTLLQHTWIVMLYAVV